MTTESMKTFLQTCKTYVYDVSFKLLGVFLLNSPRYFVVLEVRYGEDMMTNVVFLALGEQSSCFTSR